MKKSNIFVLGLVIFNTFLSVETVMARPHSNEPVFSVLDKEMEMMIQTLPRDSYIVLKHRDSASWREVTVVLISNKNSGRKNDVELAPRKMNYTDPAISALTLGITYPVFRWLAGRMAADLGAVHPLERMALASTGMQFSLFDFQLAINKTLTPEGRAQLEDARRQYNEKRDEILGRPARYQRNAGRITNGIYLATATVVAILYVYAYINQDRLGNLPVDKIVNETPNDTVPVIFVSPKILDGVVKKFRAGGFEEADLPSVK